MLARFFSLIVCIRSFILTNHISLWYCIFYRNNTNLISALQVIFVSSHDSNGTDGVIALDDLRVQSQECSLDSVVDPFTLKDFEVAASNFTILDSIGNKDWILNNTGQEADHTLGTTKGHFVSWSSDGAGNDTMTGSIVSPNYTIPEPGE